MKKKELKKENRFLTKKINEVLLENARIKRELLVSNARIVDIARDIELLQAMFVSEKGLPFADEVKQAFSDDVELVNVHKALDSFPPDVIFDVTNFPEFHSPKFPNTIYVDNRYIATNEKGLPFLLNDDKVFYDMFFTNLVSIYEAIPELVPEGMVYDKESGSLVSVFTKLTEEFKDWNISDSLELGQKMDVEKEVVEAPATFSQEEKIGFVGERMVAGDVAFSSRFMPNVLFISTESFVLDTSYFDAGFYFTDENGKTIQNTTAIKFTIAKASGFLKVSVYEAIPELVPEGMVYDKESGSLVKKS